MLETSRGLK